MILLSEILQGDAQKLISLWLENKMYNIVKNVEFTLCMVKEKLIKDER